MKKKVLMLSLFIVLNNFVYAIMWEHSYETGLNKAKKYGKPVFIDFTAKWCGWCKKLNKEVFPDPQIQKLSEHFVCIKVDGDKDKNTISKYSVRGYPTLIFLSPGGKIVERIGGYRPKESLIESMQKILKQYPPKKKPASGASEEENSKASNFYILGKKMESKGHKEQAINFYSKAAKLAPDTKLAAKAKKRISILKETE